MTQHTQLCPRAARLAAGNGLLTPSTRQRELSPELSPELSRQLSQQISLLAPYFSPSHAAPMDAPERCALATHPGPMALTPRRPLVRWAGLHRPPQHVQRDGRDTRAAWATTHSPNASTSPRSRSGLLACHCITQAAGAAPPSASRVAKLPARSRRAACACTGDGTQKGSKAAAAKPAAAKPAAKRAASAPPERPTTAANEPPPVAQPQGAAEETNLAGPLEELPAGKAYESADDEDGPAAVLEGEELVAVPEVLPALTGDAQDKRQSPTRAQNVATRVAEKTSKPMRQTRSRSKRWRRSSC